MDFYMVVWIDPEDGLFQGDPEFRDFKDEASAFAKEQSAKHPGRCYAVYRCEEVFATTHGSATRK